MSLSFCLVMRAVYNNRRSFLVILLSGVISVTAQNYSTDPGLPKSTAICEGTPLIIENNCEYSCIVLSKLNNAVVYCEGDRKTLKNCELQPCQVGSCQRATCPYDVASKSPFCPSVKIVSFCYARIGEEDDSRTPVPKHRPTERPTYTIIGGDDSKDTKADADNNSGGFSWTTLIVVVGILILCAIVLLVLEKASGFKIRDLRDLSRRPTSRTPNFVTLEPSAPNYATPTIHVDITPTAEQPALIPPRIANVSDEPPSYETVIAGSAPPPLYTQERFKIGR